MLDAAIRFITDPPDDEFYASVEDFEKHVWDILTWRP